MSQPKSSHIMQMLRLFSTAIALCLSVVLPSKAASITYSGDTTGASTFNRPEPPGFAGINQPITSLSGSNTAYFSQLFLVDQTGAYNVAGTQYFDGLQFLYQNSFNPNTPLTNLLKGDDPFGETGSVFGVTGTTTSAGFINLSLTAGTSYFLVTTGFSTPDDPTDVSVGSFTNTITGPGNITLAAVPEPSSVPSAIAVGIFSGVLILKRKLAD